MGRKVEVAKGIETLVKKYTPRTEGMQWGTRRDPVTGKRRKVPTNMMKKNVNPVTGKIYYTERTGEKAKAAEVKGIINALHSKYGKDRFYKKTPLMTKIINRTITNPKNEIVFDPVNTRQVNLIKNRMGQSPWKQSEDFLLPGSPMTKKLDSFLNQRYMNTDKKNYQMMFNSEVEKNFPNLSSKQIQVHRKKHGLQRELHQDYGGLEHGANKIKARLHSRHKYLNQDQLNALSDESKRIFKNDYVREGRRYSDEQIDEVFNLIEDVLPMTLRDPVFKAGVAKRKLIRESGKQVGHSRGTVEDTPYEAGYDPGLFEGQIPTLNERQSQLHKKLISAARRLKKGETTPAKIKGTRSSFGRIREALREMREKEMVSQYTDEFGFPRYFGDVNYNEGGIVNGYNKGGGVKKLLDDTIGMMSRRKFLKGMGATAASTAMPKGLLKATPALSKGALNFAPPWVNGMLSSLKSIKNLGALGQRRSVMGGGMSTGNDAKIINLGTKNIKVFKNQDAKITYFKIKTADEKAADDIAKSQGVMPRDRLHGWWDDVELREEPGQKTITFKNKEYDGNDQHIVIDTKNKETRFIDDNWHMEAGGEDIAKDDWIEWAITPNKNEIKVALKKPLSEIDDAVVDGYSVNDMEDYGMDSYVDSFSPSGNIFGTVERMVKKIKKKNMARQEQRKLNDEAREKDMIDWEEQFRGGKGIHGYYRGGTTMEDYPRHNLDMDRVLDSMSFVESTNNARAIGPKVKINDRFGVGNRWEKAHGQYQILPSTARQPGYNVEPWTNFSNEWHDKDKSRDFAKRYLTGLLNHNKGNWFAALSQYGGVKKPDDTTYWDLIMNQYNRGGIARRPNAVPPEKGPDPYGTFIDESVSQVMNNPSEFMGTQFIQKFNKGGYVKKNAPKVIGMITNYKPKLTMAPELKKAQSTTNQYIIYDKSLTPLHKFKTKKEGQDWLNKNYTADSNIHPEVVKPTKKTAGQRIIEEEKAEQPGAMFWGSREKIIGAPSEAMTGTQWLQYMKIGKHGILNPKGYPRIKDMELNDTSLAPWLSRMGGKTVSKEALVKQFDEMAPTMDVIVLGETTGSRIISDLSMKLKEVDTQAIRNPAIKGFFDYVKAVMPQLKESTTDDAAKGILKGIDDMVFNNFGVKDALTEGVPQRFPFEMKEVLQSLSTALGRRTAGFKTYKRTPQHRGTQMMRGGDNYREFLFKYKPGSLRSNEPEYKYAHDFNLDSADRMGGIVHTRTSDRADQFGRRLLHIEEIQSDMHQKINMAQRKLKRMHADWAKEGKTPEGEYKKMSKNQKEDYDELVAKGKYAPRGDLKEEIGTANEQHFVLVKAKIEDLLAQPQTKQTVTRLTKLKRERTKIRKLIDDEKKKMAEGNHSGVPQGPLSKTEDYNEFIMKYLLRVAREGGYDGISINTPAIKNKGLSPTNQDYKGNLVAYGPMAQGAMKKAANKSGAKFIKTYIVDDDKRAWEVPMILFKENKAAQAIIDKGLPVYKRGGTVKK